MDIAHFNAQLQGALSGKKAVLTEHIVTGPEVVTNEMAIYSPMKSDTVIIKAMASRVSDETFKLYIVIEDTYYNLREMEMPYEYHMLLETELETPADRDIPVFAYTPGIKTTREYYGEEHEVVDYCGLRDSLVHPSQWYERFGITNYIYYTVSFD
ncbi:MAG: hypothetical protein LUF87_03540 [Alistipes sp.]|nr:hypothetical protein [Alistipes sp.]